MVVDFPRDINYIHLVFSCRFLVMNVDRYLATHSTIFHRTSVTKGKLLTLFTFSAIAAITVMAISINDLVTTIGALVTTYQVALLRCG